MRATVMFVLKIFRKLFLFFIPYCLGLITACIVSPAITKQKLSEKNHAIRSNTFKTEFEEKGFCGTKISQLAGLRGQIKTLAQLEPRLLNQFTLGGKIPIRFRTGQIYKGFEEAPRGSAGYSRGNFAKGVSLEFEGNQPIWGDEMISNLLEDLEKGIDISPASYPRAAKDFEIAFSIANDAVNNKVLLVLGSLTPWVEAIALRAGAKLIITADYNVPKLDGTRFPIITTHTSILSNIDDSYFDAVISFSSLEHDGLGRYGDPLDPYADFKTISQIERILKPGGVLFLGVPMSTKDVTFDTAARVYGPIRFNMLFCGFELLARINLGNTSAGFEAVCFENDTNHLKYSERDCIVNSQPISILRKQF